MATGPLPLLPHERPLRPRIDLYVAVCFFVFSVAILALAWRMPTYADQGGQLYTAPGLVPSVYGVVIGILSIWLGGRAIRRMADPNAATAADAADDGNSNARLALAVVLGLFFVVGLIGRMPFWLATSIFVTSFVLAFEWRRALSVAQWTKQVAIALAIGVGTGALVTLVFERVFLVRLP